MDVELRHGAFILPGLIMLSLLSESISNASFGIYMPKWSGTIYEPAIGYVGAAATKSLILGFLIACMVAVCWVFRSGWKLKA